MRDALFIATHDLKMALRARETWLWTFVMPPIFFYFTGLMSGQGARVVSRPESIVIEAPAAERDTPVMRAFVRNLSKQDVKVEVKDPGAGGSSRVLVVPEGFSDSVIAGKEQKIKLYRLGGGSGAEYDDFRLSVATYQTLADLAVVTKGGGGVSAAALEGLWRKPRPLTVQVETAGRLKFAPRGYQQSVPGTTVMFTLLVLLTSGAVGLVIERSQGILKRLASSPMGRGSIVAGKWGARMGLAVVQIGFGMLTGSLVFGVRWGENLWAIALVLLAYGGLAACAAMVLGNWSKSPGQAVAVAVITSNVLAALGGCWWPVEVAPVWAQRVAIFLPTGWAMDAIHKLMSFGMPASSVVWHLAALVGLALLMGWQTARKMRFE